MILKHGEESDELVFCQKDLKALLEWTDEGKEADMAKAILTMKLVKISEVPKQFYES